MKGFQKIFLLIIQSDVHMIFIDNLF